MKPILCWRYGERSNSTWRPYAQRLHLLSDHGPECFSMFIDILFLLGGLALFGVAGIAVAAAERL